MNHYKIENMQKQPGLKSLAAKWFHEKWDVPVEAYLESIESCINNKNTVPQWYIATSGDKIIGGIGVIDDDFHDRNNLSPNICALYVEKD